MEPRHPPAHRPTHPSTYLPATRDGSCCDSSSGTLLRALPLPAARAPSSRGAGLRRGAGPAAPRRTDTPVPLTPPPRSPQGAAARRVGPGPRWGQGLRLRARARRLPRYPARSAGASRDEPFRSPLEIKSAACEVIVSECIRNDILRNSAFKISTERQICRQARFRPARRRSRPLRGSAIPCTCTRACLHATIISRGQCAHVRAGRTRR